MAEVAHVGQYPKPVQRTGPMNVLQSPVYDKDDTKLHLE